jgi:hypothetical protein
MARPLASQRSPDELRRHCHPSVSRTPHSLPEHAQKVPAPKVPGISDTRKVPGTCDTHDRRRTGRAAREVRRSRCRTEGAARELPAREVPGTCGHARARQVSGTCGTYGSARRGQGVPGSARRGRGVPGTYGKHGQAPPHLALPRPLGGARYLRPSGRCQGLAAPARKVPGSWRLGSFARSEGARYLRPPGTCGPRSEGARGLASRELPRPLGSARPLGGARYLAPRRSPKPTVSTAGEGARHLGPHGSGPRDEFCFSRVQRLAPPTQCLAPLDAGTSLRPGTSATHRSTPDASPIGRP